MAKIHLRSSIIWEPAILDNSKLIFIGILIAGIGPYVAIGCYLLLSGGWQALVSKKKSDWKMLDARPKLKTLVLITVLSFPVYLVLLVYFVFLSLV